MIYPGGISEEIYKDLVNDKESVHLEDWPKLEEKLINDDLEEKIATVRNISALALAERARLAIKVRQPLLELKIKNETIKYDQELLNLIKEEVNVKEIVFDDNIEEEIWLNPKITTALKQEGFLREIIRNIQEMRKSAGFKPGDKIIISYLVPEDYELLIEKNKSIILKETL